MNRNQTIIFLVIVSIGMGIAYFQMKQKFTREEVKPNMAPFYHWSDSLLLIEKKKVDSLTFAIKLKDMEIVENKKYYEKKLRAVPNWNRDSVKHFFANRYKK